MHTDAFTGTFGAGRGMPAAYRYRQAPALAAFIDRLDERDLGIRLQNTVGKGCGLGPKCEAELEAAGRTEMLEHAREDLDAAARRQGVALDEVRARSFGYALIAMAGLDLFEERDFGGLWLSWYNAFWEPLTDLDGNTIAGYRGRDIAPTPVAA